MIARTGGNPFFLEECVQALVETRALVGERGAHRAARAVDAVEVPATVQAMLAARIDRLPADGKHLLQCAAVIGKDVPFALLEGIADQAESALRSGLAHLQGAEFLYEVRIFPDLEYTFKHALTHDVAYASLLQERRRVLHARIVSAIETRHRAAVEHAELLGHHAIRGEVWTKAVLHLRQAGTKALSRSANREAAVHFGEALAALRHLPDSHSILEQAVDIGLDLRAAITPLGQFRKRSTFYTRQRAPPSDSATSDALPGSGFSSVTTTGPRGVSPRCAPCCCAHSLSSRRSATRGFDPS